MLLTNLIPNVQKLQGTDESGKQIRALAQEMIFLFYVCAALSLVGS